MSGETLWGAKAIATFIGVSVDTVYVWATDPMKPIYKPGGRYCANKDELALWLRSKPGETQISPDFSQ